MDADLVIFNPYTVSDNSTYEQPSLPPTGIEYVVVGGTPVVERGEVAEGVSPGKGIKAPRS